MNGVSKDHLLTTIRPLPGETVLWEGPPATSGHTVVGLQALAALLLASVLFVPIASVMTYVSRIDASSRQQRADQSQVSASGAEPHEPRRSPDSRGAPGWLLPLIFTSALGMAAGVFSMLAFFAKVLSLVRLRSAWYVVTSERICIQTGWLHLSLVTVDLDKVVSLRASSSWLERRFQLHSIEVVHAGSRTAPGLPRALMSDAYTISHVPLSLDILGTAANAWLPRDNRRRESK